MAAFGVICPARDAPTTSKFDEDDGDASDDQLSR
jgi:hypothetical protein